MKRAIAICVILLMAIAAPAIAEMYKWQDEEGVWHFTNQKPPDDVPTFEAEGEIRHTAPAYKPASADSAPEPASDLTTGPAERSDAGVNFLNPISKIERSQAKRDLKKDLSETYKGSYATIKMLLDAGMRDYDILARVPSNRINDRILSDLKQTYYPSFSTILMLYKAEVKAYKELQN